MMACGSNGSTEVTAEEVRFAEDDDTTAGVELVDDVNCNLSTPPFQLNP
jgi:hypothetical protein